MKVWVVGAGLLAFAAGSVAWAQAVPEGLPSKFGTKTENIPTTTCTAESKGCTDWCDKNNPTSATCKNECAWRVDYCKRTGLYPNQTKPNVWVGKRE